MPIFDRIKLVQHRFSPLSNINIIVIVLLLCFSASLSAEKTLEKISLRLNWKYQYQFAGFIVAKEKGFYREAGLDVKLLEYQNGIDIVSDVLEQKTNFGIHHSSIALRNKKIIPHKLLATYLQRSPYVLVARTEIKTPRDLQGKRIMIPSQNLKDTAAGLLLAHFYLTEKNTILVEPSFDIQDFIDGKVDAAAIFTTNEIFQLDQQNIDYNIIAPSDYDYATSSVNLFTSLSEVADHPKRTQAFVDASNKGWEYALSHKEEISLLIYNKFSNKKSIAALQFEAVETHKIMQPETIAIGSINYLARSRLLRQLIRSGLLEEGQILTDNQEKQVFSAEQIRYLHSKKEITMCVDPDWMPFEQIENEQHAGIVGEVFRYFSSQLPIHLKLINTKDWSESLRKAKSRECDILSLAAETPLRNEYMDFTSPYINVPLVLATRKNTFFIDNIAEVKDKKLGVVVGYAIAETLRKNIPGINIVEVDSVIDGMERVESGKLFGYIDNLMSISYSIQKDFTDTLKVSARLQDKLNLAVATRNDQPQLNEVFETLINRLSEEQLHDFYNNWITVKQELGFDYRILWVLLVFAFFTALAVILRLKMLNTKLLQQSQQIEEEKDRFKILFDKSANGLLLLDNNRIIDCNKKAVQILEYDSKQELIMKSPTEDLFSEYQPDGQLSLPKYLENRKTCFKEGVLHFEWLHCKKNDAEILLDVTFTRLDYQNKQIIHVTWRDLTEQKKYEQAIIGAREDARQANKSKSEFLANMSHEFRTPMHGILSFANFGIKRVDKVSREKLLRYFSNIKVSGDRLLYLLNDLLDLSKIEAGKMEMFIQKADLVSVFMACQLEQKQQMQEFGLKLEFTTPDKPIDARFDPIRIGQVVTNVLSNAVKFSAKNSVLIATITMNEKRELLFSLKDIGPGILESELDSIFDAFVQSSKTKKGAGGTGLGLAISRKIIEAHNGRMWVENNFESDGVTFFFSLPQE